MTNTSAVASRRSAASRAAGCFSSSPTERLLADISARYGDESWYGPCSMPAAHAEPNRRATSGFVRDSILTTSAPWNASIRQQLGAAMAIDSSTTDTSSNTPMAAPQAPAEPAPAWHAPSVSRRPRATPERASVASRRWRSSDASSGPVGVLASQPTFLDAWYAVARSVEVTRGAAAAVRLLERDLVLWRGPDDVVVAAPRSLPAPRGAAEQGHGRARLPVVPVPRLDVRRRGPLRARPVHRGERAAAAARPPRDAPLRRALRAGVGVPRRAARRPAG